MIYIWICSVFSYHFIVPTDCIAALDLLVEERVRRKADVMAENRFLFPSTKSLQHCSGWDATEKCCKKVGMTNLQAAVNATTQRGRLSTIYAAAEFDDAERKLFYSHMGHSAAVNAGTYQRPLAVQAVTRVGSFLTKVDEQAGVFWLLNRVCLNWKNIFIWKHIRMYQLEAHKQNWNLIKNHPHPHRAQQKQNRNLIKNLMKKWFRS